MNEIVKILFTAAILENLVFLCGCSFEPVKTLVRTPENALGIGALELILPFFSLAVSSLAVRFIPMDETVWKLPIGLLVSVVLTYLVLSFGKELLRRLFGLSVEASQFWLYVSVLAVSLPMLMQSFSMVHAFVFSFGAGLGIFLGSMLYHSVMPRISSKIPKAMKGWPIHFLLASLIGLVFLFF